MLSAFLLIGVSAHAQTATVVKNVNLRDDPSTDHAPIRLLKPPEVLTLLSEQEEDGYFDVRTIAGEEGWVWGNNVKIDPTAPAPASPTATIVTEFSRRGRSRAQQEHLHWSQRDL